jgi:hypothetical protein
MDLEMSKDERKRLEQLQKDGLKKNLFGSYEKLTVPDLQLLLMVDPTIQNLIRQIVEPMFAAPEEDDPSEAAAVAVQSADVEADASSKSKKGKNKISVALMHEPASQIVVRTPPPVIQYVDRIKEVIKEVIKQVPVEVRVEVPVIDPLRAELSPELKLLKAVKADAELTEAWLWAAESEGRQLVRLLTMLSEWDEVLSLWSRLADRCKSSQRAATRVELTILQSALELHNLRWRDRAARLLTAEIGATFHHDTMERGTTKGSTVAEVWLPGLENAAGQALKKPLVKLH